MKKILRFLCVSAILLLVVACSKDDKDAAFNIAGVNLHGVKYLALGSGNNAKGEDVQQMLYSIDESGNMQLVAYNYQCDDDGLETEISRNIGISINQMVPVGDNYIWLVGCRYVCNDYSGFSESMQDRIRGMVRHSEEHTENFLIRKSDGKIFDLGEVIGAFPYCIVNVPGFGNAGLVGMGGFGGTPLDGDITGDRLRKLGLINQHNGDIFLAIGTWNGGLSRLHDNGSTLSMISVLPGTEEYATNFAYAVTDNAGHLGTCISYGSNIPHVAAIMASDGTLPAIQGIPRAMEGNTYWPEMRCIGGKFFVSVHVNPWDGPQYDSIYRIDINGSQVTAVGVAAGYFSGDEYETSSTTTYISDEDTYSWYSGITLYTFNANTYQLTSNSLPAGWPQYSLYDAEGHYYEEHLGGNGLQSFTIYNLATLETEEVTCNRSQVPPFNFHKGCSYDGGMKAFIESVILANGSTVTIVTPVAGTDRGVSRVESQTEANNNVVVSTLIPLN